MANTFPCNAALSRPVGADPISGCVTQGGTRYTRFALGWLVPGLRPSGQQCRQPLRHSSFGEPPASCDCTYTRFPLVPKVSGALWERRSTAKLRFPAGPFD